MSADEITDEEYFAAMHDMERRAVAEARACESIPTEALEAGVVESMADAFQNVMGHLDTPIARRKLGISGDEPWLLGARAILSQIKGDQHG